MIGSVHMVARVKVHAIKLGALVPANRSLLCDAGVVGGVVDAG